VEPGVISLADRNETFPAIDPEDGSLWFSTYSGEFDAQTIVRAPATNSGWGQANVAPFSGRWGDRAPRFSADGRQLYITSNRPRPGRTGTGDMNVWVTTRQDSGGWSPPRLLPAPVNSAANDMHPALTSRSLFVASDRPGGFGRSDVYRIARTGPRRGEAVSMPFNDPRSQPDVCVAPDEAWIILAITDHPEGLGGDDLFLVRRQGDGWAPPVHLPAPINSGEYEYGPTLSPDGQWLYFTSHRDGTADLFRVPVAALLRGVR
jgi:hypothetical protein